MTLILFTPERTPWWPTWPQRPEPVAPAPVRVPFNDAPVTPKRVKPTRTPLQIAETPQGEHPCL